MLILITMLVMRTAQAVDPCATYYGTTAHCTSCTSATQVLLLFDSSTTICADVVAASSTCNPDSYYTAIIAQQAADSIVFKYYAAVGSQPAYCFSPTSYYKRNGQNQCGAILPSSASTSFFYNSIISLSQGCTNCIQSGYQHQSVAKLPQINLYMRECSAPLAGAVASCGLTQYYNSKVRGCTECKDTFVNCAACTDSQCTLCPKGYYMHTGVLDYSTGKTRDMCIFDVCPKGKCKNEVDNTCETSTLTNCITCKKNSVSGTQECQQCSSGYLHSSSGVCQALSGYKDLAYFVKSSPPLKAADYATSGYSPTAANVGTTPSLAFMFIQEAINAIKNVQESQLQDKIRATIYLGIGDHFFFQCDGDENQAANTDFTTLQKYCDAFGDKLQKQYFANDRIQIYFKPLFCSLGQDLLLTGNTDFIRNCLQSNQKPRIYVNDANYYFNVTGEMQFENIAFSGINAIAVPTKAANDISVFPAQFCQVTTEPTGYEAEFKRQKNSTSAGLFDFSCTDSWYQGPQRLALTNSTRRCQINLYKKFYPKQFSTLACPGDPSSSTFFSQVGNVYTSRRYTLFNLYAFPSHLTMIKNQPSLNLTNCDFEYFLGGYESLINIETNNLNKVTKTFSWPLSGGVPATETKTFYTYLGADKGARIRIVNSNFKNSRFCKGMIVYRKQAYIPQKLALTNYTHLFGNQFAQDSGSYIGIQGGTFSQLNIMNNVTAIAAYGGITPNVTFNDGAQLEDITYQAFIHKGIILNIEDFGGNLDVLDGRFQKNIHFFPEAAVMPRKLGDSTGIEQFRDPVYNEYKITSCDPDADIDRNIFTSGITMEDDVDTYFDKFERLGLFYISRNRMQMYFARNRFWRNVGTFGGAITVNSPNFRKSTRPYLIVEDCSFEQNQAFFGGNAIYLRNTKRKENQAEVCAGAFITGSQFTQNIGLKTHNGGAIAGICEYIDNAKHDDYLYTSSIMSVWVAVDLLQDLYEPLGSVFYGEGTVSVLSFKFFINNCVFQENYAGQKGSAVYLKQMSKIKIVSTRFESNGPSTTLQEFQYSPHTVYMTNRAIAFYDPEEICLDEFSYMNDCQDSQGTTIDWARVQGALHIQQCNQAFCINENDYQMVNINNCEFTDNDAGLVMDQNFPGNDNAASVYMNGGQAVFFFNTKFQDHSGSNDYYTQNVAVKYDKFFPSIFYEYAQSPVIRIMLNPVANPEGILQMRVNFTKCTFSNNKHVNILGFPKAYNGGLVHIESNFVKGVKYLPGLVVQQCTIRDNKFIGNQTSLFYVKQTLLNFLDNQVIGNGYLSQTVTKRAMVAELGFDGYVMYHSQQYGVVYLVGTEAFPTNLYHSIRRNNFQFNFAEQGSAIAMRLDNQYVVIESNNYKNNYALRGPAIYMTTQDQTRSTVRIFTETYENQFGVYSGAISGLPLNQDSLSVTMNDCNFRNCWATNGGALYFSQMAAVIAYNCNFSDTQQFVNLQNKTRFVLSQFTRLGWDIFQFIDFKFFNYITDGVPRQTGLVWLEEGLNTQTVTFANNEQLRLTSNKFSAYSEVVDCQFENSVAKAASAIYLSKGQLLRLSNTNPTRRFIRNLKHSNFGAIRLESGAQLVAENVTFTNITSEDKGGVFHVSGGSQLAMFNSSFIGNTARDKGGCLFLTGDSKFSCQQCSFRSNYAKISSTIYALNNENVVQPVTISNSDFNSNTNEESLISLLYTNASIDGTKFIDNIAKQINHGISLINSHLNASNIQVNYYNTDYLKGGAAVDSGFFSVNYQSNLILTQRSVIQNTRGSQSSAISLLGGSSLLVDNGTQFLQTQSQTGGATITIIQGNNVRISNALFQSSNQYDLYIDRTTVRIANSTFLSSALQSIYALRSTLIIQASTFKEGSNPLLQGKAIYCSCNNLTIEQSLFGNLSALEGGAIYLTSSSEFSTFTIRNTTFVNNSAMHGGAIKFQDGMRLVLGQNRFINNTARVIDPPNYQSGKLFPKALGGALNLDCNNLPMKMLRNCDVQLQYQNLFQENSAQHDGGTLIYISNSYKEDGTSKYINNKAAYGSNIASYPKELQIEFLENNDYLNKVSFAPSMGLLRARNMQYVSQTFPTVVPGQPFSFIVYIIDQNNQIYTSDSTSVATFSTKADSIEVLNNKVTASSGIYRFENVIIKHMEPGSSAIFGLSVTGLNTYGNPLPYFQSPTQIQVVSRKCGQGESLSPDKECIQCDRTNYLFISPIKTTECKICPLEAKCFGLNKIAPQPGYWRASNDSDQFIKCPNPDACLGGDEENPNGLCADGYTGILCANCQNGSRRSGEFECSPCPSQSSNMGYALILFLISGLIFLLLIRANLLISDKGKQSVYPVLLKIIVSHFQILGIVMSVDYNWPGELQQLQNGYSYFSGINQNIFSTDCFMQSAGFGDGDQTSKLLNVKLIFFAVAPILILILVSAFWGLVGLIKKRQFKDFKMNTISSTLVIFFIVHPSIARIYFETFNCIGVAQESRLRLDISSLCFQGSHIVQVSVLALPSILAWVIGVPLVSLIVLIKSNKTIRQLNQSSTLSKSDSYQIKQLRMKYGYLFEGYKTKVFFWEIVVVYRKILLVMLTVFLNVISSETQVLCGLLLLIASMILHVRFQPYTSPRMNRMENYSLQVTSLTMYAGMFYVTGRHYDYMNTIAAKWVFMLIILVPNIVFFFHWLNEFRIEILKMALARGKQMFKLVSCGLVDPDSFERRYMMHDEDAEEYYEESGRGGGVSGKEQDYKNQDFDNINEIKPNNNTLKRKQESGPEPGLKIGGGFLDIISPSKTSSQIFDNILEPPAYDTDKSNKSSGKKGAEKVPPLGFGFEQSAIRLVQGPNQDEDDVSSRNIVTNHRLRNETDFGQLKSQRDQLSTYRKVHPETILTNRDYQNETTNNLHN